MGGNDLVDEDFLDYRENRLKEEILEHIKRLEENIHILKVEAKRDIDQLKMDQYKFVAQQKMDNYHYQMQQEDIKHLLLEIKANVSNQEQDDG